MKDNKSQTSLRTLRPMLSYAFVYKKRIAAACFALVMASLATLAVPISMGRVIDHGFANQGVHGSIDRYFAFLVLVVTVLAISSAFRYYLVTTLGEKVITDVRSAVFQKIVHQDTTFFDTARSGEILSRLTADATLIKSAFGVSFSISLRNVLLFIGAVIMMVYTSAHLSSMVLMVIPLIVVPLIVSGRSVRRRSRIAQDRLADATAFASEAISASRVMQAFGMEEATANRFQEAVNDAFIAIRESAKARGWLTGVAMFLVLASVVGVLWLGAREVINGTMTGGHLSQFVFYSVLAASSLGQLSEVYGELLQASGAAERMSEILGSVPTIVSPADPVPLPIPSHGTVTFDNVGFTYLNRSIASVSNLSFSMKKGERIALVGPSGAGKSTVLQLLLRFYDCQQGTIFVDDVAIQCTDLKQLRQNLALVPQEPVIFAASVAENIRYGRFDACDEDIRCAARLAYADEFISALPNGYETQLGERGVSLSGGQRQRLAIARAILKDAPILLLDEATSALDAESEQAVQSALDTLMEGRTTLVIAHRLATIRSANRILVMENGQIVEEGTHDSLLSQHGLYSRLANLQFAQADDNSVRNNV